MSKKSVRWAKYLWPFQNIWTLYIVVWHFIQCKTSNHNSSVENRTTYNYLEKVAELFEKKNLFEKVRKILWWWHLSIFLWEIGSFFWEVNKLLLFSFKKNGIMLMYISMKLYSGGAKKLRTRVNSRFKFQARGTLPTDTGLFKVLNLFSYLLLKLWKDTISENKLLQIKEYLKSVTNKICFRSFDILKSKRSLDRSNWFFQKGLWK